MEKVYIKLKTENLVIRDPVTKAIVPPEGRWVVMSTYWRRRLNDGDMIESKPPRPPKPGAEEKGS